MQHVLILLLLTVLICRIESQGEVVKLESNRILLQTFTTRTTALCIHLFVQGLL